MSNYSVSLDMDDLVEKKKLIDVRYYELVEMFKNYQKMLEDTKEVYDTNSANYFRKVANEYMNYAVVKMEKEFKTYVDKLNDTIASYTDYGNLIASKVDKEKDNGVL